jgi:hypothetical protein
MFISGKILFHPKNWTVIRQCAQGEPDNETCCRTGIPAFPRKNLMERTTPETTPKHAVDIKAAKIKGRAAHSLRPLLIQRRDIAS